VIERPVGKVLVSYVIWKCVWKHRYFSGYQISSLSLIRSPWIKPHIGSKKSVHYWSVRREAWMIASYSHENWECSLLLSCETKLNCVRFEVFTAVTMKKCRLMRCYAVWRLLEPTFRRTYRLHHQDNNLWARNNVSRNYQPAHAAKILVVLTIEVLCSSETSILTRPTWRNIPGDGILNWIGWFQVHRAVFLRSVGSYKIDTA
jgi:hypothetical protein